MTTFIQGARCAMGPWSSPQASIRIDDGRVTHIVRDEVSTCSPGDEEIDLSGFLLMPGLVNAHDHLQFALHPRLGRPPYPNYVDWGEHIHEAFPELIAKYKSIPKDVRLWWGGIRNLLGGVTTVCHHDTFWPELRRNDFPIKVVQQFGWGHSLALGGDLQAARSLTPKGGPFILHAGEGIDDRARAELFELDRLGLIDEDTVLVHALAGDAVGVTLLHQRHASLITCPSSNSFLFGQLPKMDLLGTIKNIALGNDSPLTAEGDLLDEIRFTAASCGVGPAEIYRMVTEAPAAILRLKDGEGTIRVSASADIIAIRDSGQHAGHRLPLLSIADIEFGMVKGRVHLASEFVWERLPAHAREGLEPLSVDGVVRWIRAPIKELLRKAEEVLGTGEVRLGARKVCCPPSPR